MNEQMTAQALAARIDHTLLSATATKDDIAELCDQAMQYHFHAVCVNPRWVSFAADRLSESHIKTCAVAGFPLGADQTKTKIAQAAELIYAGADEIDMVADLAAIIEKDQKYLSYQIVKVLQQCRKMKPSVLLKIIIEAAALTDEQKKLACTICQVCGVDFIKTSTGLHPAGGATIADVELIKQYAPACKVKAAGGIKTARQALDFLDAGAERIGTSNAVEIIQQLQDGNQK